MSTEQLAAWNARQHEIVETRSRKGATQRKVVRYGAAVVVGRMDTDVHGMPLLATTDDEHTLDPAGAAARVLLARTARRETRRMRLGWSAFDILAATQAAFGDQIEPLLSTDVRQHAQVIHSNIVDAVSCETAHHRAGLSGQYRSDVLDALASHAGANGQITPTGDPSLTARPSRVKLSYRPRKNDPATIVTPCDAPGFIGYGTAAGWRTLGLTWHMVTLPAPAADTDHVWHGHRLLPRVKAVTPHTRKRADRTVATLDAAPSNVDAWAILLDAMNRGERATVPGVTFTRGKDGRYSAVDKREGRAHRWQSRTAEGLALKLA